MRNNRFNTVTMVFTMVTACFVLVTQALSTAALAEVEQVKAPQNRRPRRACRQRWWSHLCLTFEGWGPLKDGTNALLLGYFNRNKTQLIDIPVGPDNSIEPGGP